MPFRLPELKRCCCFRLRTGALIIGYYLLISALLSIATIITVLVLVSMVASDKPPPPNSNQAHIDKATALRIYVAYGFQLMVFTVYFAVTLMLIIGVHKNIPRYLRYYFILGGVTLIANLILITITVIYNGFVATFVQLIGCAIQFYFLLVIRSAALEMSRQSIKPLEVELGAHPIPAGAPGPVNPGPPEYEQAAPLMQK